MSFLNPLLWLGVLGIAAPIWLHLRERPARNVVPFSTLRFLEDAPRPRNQPLRLRDLLLLALRSAALLLVVGGFAWPYWRGAAAAQITTSRVHILDNTLSRQVDGGFESDRQRLRQELAGAGAEVQDAVIELTAQPRVVAGFGDSRADALTRLDSLTPSFERGSYLEAFRLAASLLDQSLGDRRQIVVLGDGQENQWSEHETVPPFLRDVEVVLAARPAAVRRPNVSLSTPVVRRVLQGNQALVELTARLRHDGGGTTATVTV